MEHESPIERKDTLQSVEEVVEAFADRFLVDKYLRMQRQSLGAGDDLIELLAEQIPEVIIPFTEALAGREAASHREYAVYQLRHVHKIDPAASRRIGEILIQDQKPSIRRHAQTWKMLLEDD